MLLRIELSNFFSIKDKVCVDFQATNIHTVRAKELADNVMEWNGMQILKSIGLFGPNASGKSNIIRSVKFCCQMILQSHLHNEGDVFNFEPFRFDGYDKKPSCFLIDFVCEDIEYEYSFELTKNEIIKESLFFYPKKRRAKIFTRDETQNNVYSFAEGIISRPQDVVLNTSKKNLFLSRASSMNREIAQRVYRFFLGTFMLGIVPNDNYIAEQNFTKYKDLIMNALAISDSDIVDIELKHEKIRMGTPHINGENITIESNDKMVARYKTRHRRNPQQLFDMDTEESDGTKRLFDILLNLLDVLRNDKALMMDEFDLKLHTRLADFILDLTHASRHSQLLFTSHNTNLIDVKRLRKDQIYFVNKKEDSSTDLYSLYDYKDFRDNMDAEKAYIQGRFDAVPYVESSVLNLKKLLED